MRIPRDLNGAELARRLATYGYPVTRQSGSHRLLSRQASKQQRHLTIPAHKPLRVGSLRQILKDVSSQSGISLEEIVQNHRRLSSQLLGKAHNQRSGSSSEGLQYLPIDWRYR